MGDFRVTVHGKFTDINIDLQRIADNTKKAQFALDTQVMRDMNPLMPRQTGAFIQLTQARSAANAGQGIVYAGVGPMGHYLHTGKVMVDPETGSPWARKGVTKIYTDRDLKLWYPGAQTHWFDVAKEQHLKEWLELVDQTIREG